MLPRKASDIIVFMRKFIAPFLLLSLIIVVFHSWFSSGFLTSNDFLYFSKSMIKDATFNIYAWDWHSGLDGFARFVSPYSWIFPFINFPQVVFGKLGFDWTFIERVVYFYPLLMLLIFSPILLVKYFFPKNKFYLFSVLIFSFNTYSLLLAGGEIFLALAYSLMPIVLVLFAHMIDIRDNDGFSKYKYSFIAGLVFAVQIMIDPRFAFVTVFCVVFYSIFYAIFKVGNFNKDKIKKYVYNLIFIFLIPGIIAVLLHAFWIIPSIMHGGNPVEALGVSYSTGGAVQYLSFAKLENTISLLHPNWPENIFGKVYFMRPEFLLLPVLAFASLFFISKTKDQKTNIYVLFFALLGLVGAFLAKGANDPFGAVYLWAFNHIPGFIMFRDPAKWYPLVAISYSILIPFSIWKIYEWLQSQPKFLISNFKFLIKFQNRIINLQNLFIMLITLYLILLIRPAILGQLGGMFKATVIPNDYVKLEKFLVNQPDYFRTLWIPSKQRFGYYSNNHPEMSAQVLFNVTDNQSLFKKLSEENTENLLQEASIKYVIIPYDSEKEIFLSDWKYDNLIYLQTVRETQKIPWLKQVASFGKIIVFAVPNPKGHFWSPSKTLSLAYEYINPVKYSVNIKNAKKGDIIVFAESYDVKWIAENSTFHVQSSKFDNKFNSFVLPANGNYNLRIYYTPQDYVNIGLVISGITLFVLAGGLLFLIIKKK
jgi:hypothetical protein